MQVDVAGYGGIKVEDGPNAVSSLGNLAETLADLNFPLANIREIIEGAARQLPAWMTGGGPRIDSIIDRAMSNAEAAIARDPAKRRRQRGGKLLDLTDDMAVLSLTQAAVTPAEKIRRNRAAAAAAAVRPVDTAITTVVAAQQIGDLGKESITNPNTAITKTANQPEMRIGAVSDAFKDVEATQITSKSQPLLAQSLQAPLLPDFSGAPKESLICSTSPTSFKGCPLISEQRGFQFSLTGPAAPILEEVRQPTYLTSQTNPLALPAPDAFADLQDTAPELDDEAPATLMLAYQPTNAPTLEQLGLSKMSLRAPVLVLRG